MENTKQYTFSILRYIHDGVTQEFVNIGVVLYAYNEDFFIAKFTDDFSRIGLMFNFKVDDWFAKSVGYIEREIGELSLKLLRHNSEGRTLCSFLSSILPKDDSCLQFSGLGVGIAEDLEVELESIYQRYVARYLPKKELDWSHTGTT